MERGRGGGGRECVCENEGERQRGREAERERESVCVREREQSRAEQVDKLGWKPCVVNIVQCDRVFLASLLTQEKSRIMPSGTTKVSQLYLLF